MHVGQKNILGLFLLLLLFVPHFLEDSASFLIILILAGDVWVALAIIFPAGTQNLPGDVSTADYSDVVTVALLETPILVNNFSLSQLGPPIDRLLGFCGVLKS